MAAGIVWLNDDRWHDLIVILDDATSEIYYAQLVEEESTRTVMAGLRAVIENEGLFCALYSDRGSHFFVTPKAGEKVDKHRLTQVGRAMKELGVQMIPAYSPQARGRSERSFGTWQGRLPQELRLAGIADAESANRFLDERYVAEFNSKFTVAAAAKGAAFRRASRSDLNWVFTVQTERVVAKDNTVAIGDRHWQLEKTRFRSSLAGCTVTLHEHLDRTMSIRYGPHVVGRYAANGTVLEAKKVTSGSGGKGGPPLRRLVLFAEENPPHGEFKASERFRHDRTDHVSIKPDRLTNYGQINHRPSVTFNWKPVAGARAFAR
ncbi:MAG: hypothetical protein ACKV22_18565 [Bryobacteraceae bacterium]